MHGINEKEREALKAFRERIGDCLEKMDSYDKHDLNVLRWLRARDLDIDKAEEMFRNVQNWRKEKNIDSILKSWQAPSIFAEEFPLKISGQDKDGCVVCFVPGGRWDLVGLVAKGYKEDYTNFWTQILEQGINFMKQKSEGRSDIITQFVLIIDLEGLPLRQVVSREKVAMEMQVLRLVESSYPETLKAAYIINAPKIFEVLFAFLKPMLTGHTLSKVKVFGSNQREWRAALLENIDPQELPSVAGGANTSCSNYVVQMGMHLPPRGKTFPEESFQSITVKAAQKFRIEIQVDAIDTLISWNFKSEGFEIGFKFLGEADEEIFSCGRADAHLHTQKGAFVAKKMGKYTLCFDNTSSKTQAKNIKYVYDLVPSPVLEK